MSDFHFVRREQIHEGWSEDRKYCAIGEDGTRYLLRISPIEQYERKQAEFRMMEQAAALGERGRTSICDIDFFRRQPCVNDMGRMWGSSLFQAPEEYRLGAVLDEVTNVYTAGAFAFALFGGYERTRDRWQLDDSLFAAAKQAVEADRDRRQQSIRQFREAWEEACSGFVSLL